MSSKTFHLHRRLGRALAWSVLGAGGAVLVLAVLLPRVAGGTPYTILTGSMRPALPPGTLVVTRPVAAADVQVGEVITFQLVSGEPAVVTHRVVGQGISAGGERVLRTQGDANRTADTGWVRPVQLRGRQWYAVPYVGHLTSRIGASRDAVQLVLVAGLATYAAAMFTAAARDRTQRHRPGRPAVQP